MEESKGGEDLSTDSGEPAIEILLGGLSVGEKSGARSEQVSSRVPRRHGEDRLGPFGGLAEVLTDLISLEGSVPFDSGRGAPLHRAE